MITYRDYVISFKVKWKWEGGDASLKDVVADTSGWCGPLFIGKVPVYISKCGEIIQSGLDETGGGPKMDEPANENVDSSNFTVWHKKNILLDQSKHW